MLNNFYTPNDFLRLSIGEVDTILDKLDVTLLRDEDKFMHLYNFVNVVLANTDCKEIFTQKILAGKLSLKYYSLSFDEQFTKGEFVQLLNSYNNCFERNMREYNSEDVHNDILCIYQENSKYYLKISVDEGKRRLTYGTSFQNTVNPKIVIAIIDIENEWIEIRASETICKKTVNVLNQCLKLQERINEIPILNQVQNINEFKDSLNDGRWFAYRANPTENLQLTDNDTMSILKIVREVDNYLASQEKDGVNLLDSLSNVEFDSEGLTIESIILAGIEKFSIRMRDDSEKDISAQTLYSLLEEHLSEDTGYISFALPDSTFRYTIQVGKNTNSISFKTSATENAIEYIRSKVI